MSTSSETPRSLAAPVYSRSAASASSLSVTSSRHCTRSLQPALPLMPIPVMLPCLLPSPLLAWSPRQLGALAGKPPESWTVEEVVEFMCTFPDFAMHASKFRIHLIDGEAMLLLEVRHLVRVMENKAWPSTQDLLLNRPSSKPPRSVLAVIFVAFLI
ncbi:hypothetical protein MRX96_025253 [Rhipicephalus microplus]